MAPLIAWCFSNVFSADLSTVTVEKSSHSPACLSFQPWRQEDSVLFPQCMTQANEWTGGLPYVFNAFMNPVVRKFFYMFILFPIHLSGTSDAPPMPGGCPVKTSAVKKVWRKKTVLASTQTLENHPKSRFTYTKESTWVWTVSLSCCRIRKTPVFCQLLLTCHCPSCAFE